MAVVEMPIESLAGRKLPPVCMRCGAVAVVRAEHTFWWYPPSIDRWHYLWHVCVLVLPLCIVLAACYRQRLRVAVPLCGRHEGYWSWRAWYTWGGLGGLLATGSAILLLLARSPSIEAEALFGGLGVGWAVAAILWLGGATVLWRTGIRLEGGSEQRIILHGVATTFVEALQADQQPPLGRQPGDKRARP